MLASLDGEPLRPLPVTGFGDAVVSAPLGATERRPIVIALHGNYDRPEWQCEVWREITSGFPWVLCPRGTRRGDAPKTADRYTFAGLGQLEKELQAGLEALERKYPRYVDGSAPLLVGFSLGAILGVQLLRRADSPFLRAVLVEGGYEGWGAAGARAFANRGGDRLLLACGQTACRHAGKQVERLFTQKDGVRVVFAGNVGHTYDGSVAEAIRDNWPWVVETDRRFPRSRDDPTAHPTGHPTKVQ